MPPRSRHSVLHPRVLLCVQVPAEDGFCHQEFLLEIRIVAAGGRGLLARGVWWFSSVCYLYNFKPMKMLHNMSIF